MSKTKKKLKKFLKPKKNWKKRELEVLERHINQKKKKPLTIVQYFFGNLEDMERYVARRRYFKNNNKKH